MQLFYINNFFNLGHWGLLTPRPPLAAPLVLTFEVNFMLKSAIQRLLIYFSGLVKA